MSLSVTDVMRIAHLARVEIQPEEAETTLHQLTSILGLVEEMQAVDTSGVAPMAHAQDVVLRLRPDVVTEPDRRDAFQQLTPHTEAGLYLVPKVIE